MSVPRIGAAVPHRSEKKPSGSSILDRFEPVIGLEVHCQLNTKTKLFCGCTTEFGALPNVQTCPVCLGLPGVLPVLNQEAVNFAIRFALAVNSQIRDLSIFSRKQYFYPDLPKGYQITQYDLPYCSGGYVRLGSGKTVRLIRAHLEEDAGKSIHGEASSYVDLNRAGVPLLEIVSEPDLRTPEEASDFLKRLRALVKTLNISDGNLEEGSFRCDVNVSVRQRGSDTFGTRCEIKNLNSFRNIERAIKYEIMRQVDLIEYGERVQQQTLLFDAATGKTQPMRSKEESQDYRYFPDPDLMPLKIDSERIADQKLLLPELPEALAERFQGNFGLSSYDSMILTADKDLASFYEDVVQKINGVVSAKIVANWLITEFLREVNDRGWDLANPPVKSHQLAELLELIGTNVISGRIAKKVFEEMASQGSAAEAPKAIIEKHGWVQVSNVAEISDLISSVLNENPDQVAEYLSGREKIFGFFIGQIMRRSGGKMNPQVVNDVLRELLDARRLN